MAIVMPMTFWGPGIKRSASHFDGLSKLAHSPEPMDISSDEETEVSRPCPSPLPLVRMYHAPKAPDSFSVHDWYKLQKQGNWKRTDVPEDDPEMVDDWLQSTLERASRRRQAVQWSKDVLGHADALYTELMTELQRLLVPFSKSYTEVRLTAVLYIQDIVRECCDQCPESPAAALYELCTAAMVKSGSSIPCPFGHVEFWAYTALEMSAISFGYSVAELRETYKRKKVDIFVNGALGHMAVKPLKHAHTFAWAMTEGLCIEPIVTTTLHMLCLHSPNVTKEMLDAALRDIYLHAVNTPPGSERYMHGESEQGVALAWHFLTARGAVLNVRAANMVRRFMAERPARDFCAGLL